MRKLLIGLLIALTLIFALILIYKFNIIESPDEVVNIELLRADSLMFIKPDSSLSILENLKDLKKEDKKTNALYALLLSQARSRCGIKQTNDSLINIALNYYEKSNDLIRKAWTYVTASYLNDYFGEKKRAIDYIYKAAITAKNCNDNRLLCYIYYFWGRLLQGTKPYQDSIDKLRESEKYARQLNDTILIISRIKDIGWDYLYMNDQEQANELFSYAIILSLEVKSYDNLAYLYKKQSYVLSECGEYYKALEKINKAIEYINYIPDSLSLYNNKGSIFIGLNQLDSARYYIERGQRNETFYNKAVYQSEMADIEAKSGNYRKAFEHKTAYANYLDSISEYEENNSVMELQRRYDYAQYKAKNNRLEMEKQQRGLFLLLSIVALIAFMLAAYIAIVVIKKRSARKIKIKDQMLAQSKERLQSKSNELIVSKKIHKDAEDSLLNNLMNKQEELSKVKSREQEFVNYIFSINEVIQKIESLKEMNEKKKKSMALSAEELNGLVEAIDLGYNNFTVRLKKDFPNLKEDDIYLCCMLKMKLSAHDIAVLLNISEDTLRKRKYRLKLEKFNLPQDSEPLDKFIENY